MNGMPHLAERLDDAMVLLLAEGRKPAQPARVGTGAGAIETL